MSSRCYRPGQTVPLAPVMWTDAAGSLADPTSVSLLVTRPDLTTLDPIALVRARTGVWVLPATTLPHGGGVIHGYTIPTTTGSPPAPPPAGQYSLMYAVMYEGQSYPIEGEGFEVTSQGGTVEPSIPTQPLATLVGMVRNQIRDNGTPQAFPDAMDYALATPSIVPNSSPELSQFVQDSLAEFSRYRPLRKPFTLQIVAGQTTYNLPSDWITRDAESFDRATRHDRARGRRDRDDFMEPCYGKTPFVVDGPLGGCPEPLRFEWYDELQQVAIWPAPQAQQSIRFDYNAAHQPSTIPAQWVDAALMPACERALRAIAVDQAVKLQEYKIAHEIQVDNRTIADKLLKQAESWREQFRRSVVLRPHGGTGG